MFIQVNEVVVLPLCWASTPNSVVSLAHGESPSTESPSPSHPAHQTMLCWGAAQEICSVRQKVGCKQPQLELMDPHGGHPVPTAHREVMLKGNPVEQGSFSSKAALGVTAGSCSTRVTFHRLLV